MSEWQVHGYILVHWWPAMVASYGGTLCSMRRAYRDRFASYCRGRRAPGRCHRCPGMRSQPRCPRLHCPRLPRPPGPRPRP